MKNYSPRGDAGKSKFKINKIKIKIHKGDLVKVTAGKDKDKTGKVEKVFRKNNKVLVAGVNLYKRHIKPKGEGKPGGIIDFPRPLPMANIALICPHCQKPARVGYKFKEGKKYRFCKKCEEEFT